MKALHPETLDRLIDESRAVDRQTLASYLFHATSEEDGRAMIEQLKRNHPAIFRKPVYRREHSTSKRIPR
jgi:hypothetical protein